MTSEKAPSKKSKSAVPPVSPRGQGEGQDAAQFSRFVETARALGCDEDKERFEAQLGKIAEHKPTKEKTLPKPVRRERKKKPNAS